MVAYIFGVGTDALDDVFASLDDRKAMQEESPDPEFEERGNFATNTGTRVCDLRITFFATAHSFDPTTPDPLEGLFGNLNIFHGGITAFGDPFFRPLAGNQNIFDYQWFCQGPTTTPLELLSWNLQKNTIGGLEQLSLLALGQVTDRERIEVNFFGTAIGTGKELVSPSQPSKGSNSNPFTKAINLPRGVEFPVDYSIQVYLENVTEDNYIITFWDNQWEQNGESPGHRFSPKDVCKPGLTSC